MSQLISNVVGTAITLFVGIRIFEEMDRVLLYTSDYQAYVERYLIPEQVYEANRWLKRSPRYRIVVP